MDRKGVLLGIIAALTVNLGCGSEDDGYLADETPAPPIYHEERIDLWELDLSVARSSVAIETGNRVEVAVDVRQQGDEYAQCARPSVMDTYGNLVTMLSPHAATPGAGASYKYAFVAPAAGQYTVELDNRECNVRRTPSSAVVAWTVYQR